MIENNDPSSQDDPVYLRTRREAFLILGLWAVSFAYSVTYSYLTGYPTDDNHQVTYPYGLGIPDWIFWGVVVPWAICILLTIIFCQFIYVEEDLGVDQEEQDAEE